jgi:hypothetical protein
MAIFVDLIGDHIKVSGDTYPINRVLGAQGLKFKFSKDRKEWRGAVSGKALATLAEQSGAIVSSDAMAEMERFRVAAEKRSRYMAGKKGGA